MIHGFEERRDVHRLGQIGIESYIQGFMDVFSHGVGGHSDHREGGGNMASGHPIPVIWPPGILHCEPGHSMGPYQASPL